MPANRPTFGHSVLTARQQVPNAWSVLAQGRGVGGLQAGVAVERGHVRVLQQFNQLLHLRVQQMAVERRQRGEAGGGGSARPAAWAGGRGRRPWRLQRGQPGRSGPSGSVVGSPLGRRRLRLQRLQAQGAGQALEAVQPGPQGVGGRRAQSWRACAEASWQLVAETAEQAQVHVLAMAHGQGGFQGHALNLGFGLAGAGKVGVRLRTTLARGLTL